MSAEKEVTIRITDPGDSSVGIWEATVNIEPAIFLEDEYREKFREKLKEAFNYVMDTPHVVFSDEEQKEETR